MLFRLLAQDSTVRWAARDAIVAASREFEIDGTPSTMLTLEMLAMNGYNRCICGAVRCRVSESRCRYDFESKKGSYVVEVAR